jgi:hypothetical protein
MSKKLFNVDAASNNVEDAYKKLLINEADQEKNQIMEMKKCTLLEEQDLKILSEDAIVFNEDGTFSIMLETITVEQWEAIKRRVEK